ncbi:MAG TPA: YolD-like family protein [Bacillota bacterium]|nr:YolD-like family protein [Bacillota bacterium]
MLKDRGTIKWTSLMLPEHVQMLKELWAEDEKKLSPQLDEQLLAELNDQLKIAWQQHKKVRLTVYLNGREQHFIGIIKHICTSSQSIIFAPDNTDEWSLSLTDLTNIEQVDDD